MRKIEKYSAYKIFTPSTVARLTFIEREKINDQLVDAIKTPGKQIIIYGHSGSGKSTLFINKLDQTIPNYIKSSCMLGMTLNELILDAFDQLNKYYSGEKELKSTSKFSSEIGASYNEIKAVIKAEHGNDATDKLKRVIATQLTPQRLAQFFSQADCCWMIDDFHKLAVEEKQKLSQVMKIFMDSATEYNDAKIAVIGAVGSAREIIQLDREMMNRVSEIGVPLMVDRELESIIEKGEKLLNVVFPDLIKRKIIFLSSGLAAVCHQICLNMCLINNINESVDEQIYFNENDLKNAIDKYLYSQSDTLQSSFDKATKVKRTRTYQNGRLILRAMVKLNKEKLSLNEILNEIKKDDPDYPQGNLKTYIYKLTQEDCDEVIRVDTDSNKYYFSDPFFKSFCAIKFDLERRGEVVEESLFLNNEENSRVRKFLMDRVLEALEKLDANLDE